MPNFFRCCTCIGTDDDDELQSARINQTEGKGNHLVVSNKGDQHNESNFNNIFVRASSLIRIPLFEAMSAEERILLSKNARKITFNPNDIITREGDPSDGMYLIQKGSAQITEDNKEISILKSGDYFGEGSVLHKEKRNFTVTAIETVVCYIFDHETYKQLTEIPKISLSERRDPVFGHHPAAKSPDVSMIDERSSRKISLATTDFLKEKFGETMLLEELSDNQILSLIAKMKCMHMKPFQFLMKYGETSSNFYIVEAGDFSVYDKNSEFIGKSGRGTCMSQIALLHEIFIENTVQFDSYGKVWCLSQEAYQDMVTGQYARKAKEYEKFINSINILNALSPEQTVQLAESVREIVYKKDEPIIKQGDEINSFYIVVNGSLKMRHKKPNNEIKKFDDLKRGSYFGEQTLISKEPSVVTVIPIEDSSCLVINSEDFIALLGPLNDLMARRLTGRKGSLYNIQNDFLDKPDFKDLKTVGVLGKGAFGLVSLVRDRRTNNTYALKAVSKAKVAAGKQEHHIVSERKTLISISHPFIIKLFGTYKDKKNVYFLLEPILGGELFQILRKRNTFDENTARFYAASIILVFEYLHNLDIIYRDLKPENIMLADDGYIKLADLGFSKKLEGNRPTYTLCGTPDYLAPEVLLSKGHHKGVDWWTLGIFIFEMVASYPPFYAKNRQAIYKKIIRASFKYPAYFSGDLVDLISGLLEVRPHMRLGVIKGGSQRVKDHPWFNGFDWDKLYNKELKAPIIIPIKNAEDRSNFRTDHIKKDKTKYTATTLFPGWDNDF